MLNFIHFSQCTQACMHCICHIIWPFHILRHSVFITGCYIVTQVTVSHCLNHHLLFIESAVSVILHQRRERSDANLGECAVSFPVSSIWLPNIPSSQLPLTIDRSALGLMWALNCVYTLGFASCFYCRKLQHALKLYLQQWHAACIQANPVQHLLLC